MVDQVLDTKGLNCPLPIVKAKKAIKGMAAGAILQVDATDPAAVPDFEAFCRATGNEMVGHSEDGGVFSIQIRVTG